MPDNNLSLKEKSFDLHQSTGVIDTHCDTIHLFRRSEHGSYKFGDHNKTGHLDLPRMEIGAIKVQFFAVFIEPEHRTSALHLTLQLIEHYYQALSGFEKRITHVENYYELEQVLAKGKIASVLAIEGGEVIGSSLELLRMLHRLGVRSFGLTWNHRNQIADGVGEEAGAGLTRFGFEVVAELNKLGVIIDVAHLSESGFWDVLETSSVPVIVSHANAYAVCNHPRNLKDSQLKGLAENGGIISLSFYPKFIGKESVKISNLVDHYVHIASLIGVEHLGVGSDFDGIDETIEGLADVSQMSNLTEALLKRGFKEQDVKKILKENYLRLLHEVLR